MKTINKPLSKCMLLCAAICLQIVFQSQTFAQDKAAKIDEVIRLANSYGQFNGAVLVADNGKAIYRKGIGFANIEWNVPNEVDTKFRLGSITKQFTSMLILQMVEENKIKLDGKLSDYLPDYRKDTGERVTVHQLLTHTSGIPSYTNQPGFFADVSRNPYSVGDFVKKYASGDLEFEPNSKFSYNNSGYFLLGAIIEKVAGKPYEQVLKEKILDPLGMKNTGYDHHNTVIPKRAAGYIKTASGYENAPYLDMSLPYAAGSMYSTVDDLFLWDKALYGDGLLSSKYKDLMFKPNIGNYAYGWIVTKTSVGKLKESVSIVTHGGGINGFNTTIVRLVDRKHAIIMLDNTSQGRYLETISRSIINILYDQPFDAPKRSLAETLYPTVTEKGVEAAIKQYRELKVNQTTTYDFGEGELNTLGYQLLGEKRIKDAIEVFKLNVEIHPLAANPYDSLGEVYMMNGDKELALKNYKRSLELNPQNANAVEMVKRIEQPQPATAKVDAKIYDAYVGRYELAPSFVLTISKDGDKLSGQATGQGAFELSPESETKFFVREVNARITFVKDDKGIVTGLILQQGGRDMPAKKL